MQEVINSVRDSLSARNWYAALFVALTLPDLCVALENGKTSGQKYSEWFEQNVTQYKGFLSGDDCYALRCATLHEGKDDISTQRMKDVLEHYIFLTAGSHRVLFKDSVIDGVKESFLQLNVQKFCEEICTAAETWLGTQSKNQDVQARLSETLKIREPGYVYKGIIKFG